QAIGDWTQRQAEDFVTYRDFVKQAADDYGAETLRGQLEVLKLQTGSAAIKRIERFMAVFVQHTDEFRKSGRVDQQKWLSELSPRRRYECCLSSTGRAP